MALYTICFSLYSSLVSIVPVEHSCKLTTYTEVQAVQAACYALDKDPLATCEMKRGGLTKWFVTVRQLDMTPEAGPLTPAGKGGRA